MRAPALATLPVLLLAASAAVSASAAASPLPVTAAGGPGQQTLALRAEGGAVRAGVCASGAACTPDGGALLPIPEDARALLPKAAIETVTLAGGRIVLRLDLPGDTPGTIWTMLLAAPPTGKGAEPLLLWSGWVGAVRGEHGEEHSAAVVEEPLPGGGARLLVGERRADVTICGRPTLVGAREVDPATLAVGHAASVQNLGAAERAAATKITAARARGDAPRSEVRLLRATAASSAVERKIVTLTDGDAATAWSESRQGDGRGEFVSMSSAEDVGITAFDLVVRPTEDLPDGAAPKRIYLATAETLVEVTLPEDAWKQPPGTRYTVKLPAELHASCVAVVLDESFAPAGKAAARVTIAEIEARTVFDGASPEALANALFGGGERARAAAALLERAGKAGIAAALGAYEKLDDEGRRLAAQVVDAAPCAEQVPFFAARFAAASATFDRRRAAPGEIDPELAHARDRLRRCGRAAAPALAKLVVEGSPPRTRVAAADELSLLAPDAAVPALLDAMGNADDAVRHDLRAALARAAKSPRALSTLRDEVARPKIEARSEAVAIDLLRAVGPIVAQVDGAGDALAALAAKSTSARARYLLQGPAAELGRAGDHRAEGYVREALRKDEDAHVRRRAAEVAGGVPGLAGDLLGALDDPDPRVREAAIDAFAAEGGGGGGGAALPGLSAALGKRLATDDWTFVRAGAARTLGSLPAEASVDAALATALEDGSPDVRGRALDALGAHHATAHADAVRSRQDDGAEDVEVRAHAMLALGTMCDTRSIGEWTKLAAGAKAPLDDKAKRLGNAAIAALGAVHPKDLGERLAPLLEKDAPLLVREMAKAAMGTPEGCR